MSVLIITGIVLGAVTGSLGALFVTNRTEMSVLKRFFRCDYCASELSPGDSLPVLGFARLKGRCRSCKRGIPVIYIAMELSCAALWALAAYIFGIGPFTPTAWTLCAACVIASAYDLKTGSVPDMLHLFLFIVGGIWCAACALADYRPLLESLLGFFAVSAPLLLLSALTKGGVGGADVKFMAVCGLILGWRLIILALLLGMLCAALHLLPLRLMGKISPRAQVPILPYLSAGVMASMFWGETVLFRYTGLFLA